MPLPQNPAVVNSLLLVFFGAGGFWLGNQSQKPAAGPVQDAATMPIQVMPGDCWRDARRIFASERESWPAMLREVVARYGRNRPETEMLAAALMARWSAADPAGAAAEGWPLVREAAPALFQSMMASSSNGGASDGESAGAGRDAPDVRNAAAAMVRAAEAADRLALDRMAARWIVHDRTAAWDFAAAQKDSPHAPVIAMALLQADASAFHCAGRLDDLRTLLARVFSNGAPAEASLILIRALAAESPATAVNFTNGFATPGGPLQAEGMVVLFDVLTVSDPAMAWRTGNSAALRRDVEFKPWTAEGDLKARTPAERVTTGFPSRLDLLTLADVWLALDPHGALSALCAAEVPGDIRSAVIAEATRTDGPALTREALQRWAERTGESLRRASEPLLK